MNLNKIGSNSQKFAKKKPWKFRVRFEHADGGEITEISNPAFYIASTRVPQISTSLTMREVD